MSVNVFPFTENGLSGSFVFSMFGRAMPPIEAAVLFGAEAVEVEETRTVVVSAVRVSCLSILGALGLS